jgi:arylsulfatase A-like enzyme
MLFAYFGPGMVVPVVLVIAAVGGAVVLVGRKVLVFRRKLVRRVWPQSRGKTPDRSLSPRCALVLAAWFGLVGGAIDLGLIHLKRDVFHWSFYYEQGRHFRWVVPVANLAVMMVPGLLVAGLNRLRPGFISARSAAWAYGTLAIWGPLLRASLYGAGTLLLAVGVSRVISGWFASPGCGFRRFARCSLPVLAALVAATAVVSYGRQVVTESRAVARLPAPPEGACNVLLIVMDTVRAANLGLYGYTRDTTPHLERWAKRGVRFEWALAPAPWTFPSHCSLMTGQWPSTLNAHWPPTLDPAYPTVATFLASRGYLTAGFAANTDWCSYESGMDRGFTHYEDYPLTLQTVLGSTVPGRWILENLLNARGFHGVKWIRSQSRDAEAINHSFLDWLSGERQRRRPFFAFLNYLDAHEPFLPPDGKGTSFGLRPRAPSESKMLLEYWDRDKLKLSERDVELVRDSYDDCIAALDRQVGSLLDELERRNVLRETLVIITSDHGEEFGEHGIFCHGYSLYAHEVHVPLLIITGKAPPGRTVVEPVSLRDLPATIMDLCALDAGSTFPGRPLAAYWRQTPGAPVSRATRAFSEVAIPRGIRPERGRGSSQKGFTVSLVSEGLHYVVGAGGNEELYELATDPEELRNLNNDPGQDAALVRLRKSLGELLREDGISIGEAGNEQERFRMLLESP